MSLMLACLLDFLLGDPPNRFHPTAWMGSLIAFLLRFRPRGNRFAELAFGAFILVTGLSLAIGAGWLMTAFAASLPLWAGILVQATALKLTISPRGLNRAARAVQLALESGNLPEARRLLAWHLVSRNTSQLDESKVSAATIESVAENASDGVIAPLFFFAIGGLPAALAYRFANTADSMLGYHDAEREWLGKIPARLDDLLNFIPARLTGLLITLAAFLAGANGGQAWRILLRDAGQTASPNAGFPMSAMAGALGVELEKIGHYTLGQGLAAPNAAGLARARRLFSLTILLAILLFTVWGLYVQPR